MRFRFDGWTFEAPYRGEAGTLTKDDGTVSLSLSRRDTAAIHTIFFWQVGTASVSGNVIEEED